MHEILVLLANCTSFDVISYPLIHIGPPVSLLGFVDSFVSAQMSGSGVIVHKGHNTAFHLGNSWDMDLAF